MIKEDFKEVVVDKHTFQIIPMGGIKAMLLDKKIITMLVPVMGGLKDMDAEIDFKLISEGIYEALSKLSEIEYKKLILDLLAEVIFVNTNAIEGDAESPAMTEHTIDKKFGRKLMVLYKLIIEVMRFNKFTPFEMVAGGKRMSSIISSFKQKKNTKKNGKK